MSQPIGQPIAGFDYTQAVLELRTVMSYARIAEGIGYTSKNAISRLVAGAEPSHKHGEMLYILYFETFNRKPK